MSAERGGEAVEIVYRLTVEIDGKEKSACVEESVVGVYPWPWSVGMSGGWEWKRGMGKLGRPFSGLPAKS